MRALLVLLAAIAFAIAPFLSPEFGGFDPELYPIPQNNPPVQPIGWAFSIWGIIYLALLAHTVYGFVKKRRDADWQRGRTGLFISLAVGAIWLPVALLSPIWATILIWVMLLTVLISLYQTNYARPIWAARWPAALYAGWLTAASFVSIGLMLGGYGLLSELNAALAALVLAAGFAAINAYYLRAWPYGAAAAWGFFGIGMANLGGPLVIASGAFAAAAVMAAISAWRRKPHHSGFSV